MITLLELYQLHWILLDEPQLIEHDSQIVEEQLQPVHFPFPLNLLLLFVVYDHHFVIFHPKINL